MSSSKLSDPEKQEIVKLYQEVPEETTITLAERYGVSSSTVRRVLQSAIPKSTYDTLTQQKQRLHRTGKKSERNTQKLEEESTSTTEPPSQPSSSESETSSSSDVTSTLKRRRKRSSASDTVNSTEPEISMASESSQDSNNSPDQFEDLIDEDFLSPNEEFGEFDQDEDEEEDDFEEDSNPEEEDFYEPPLPFMGTTLVQILPLTEASLPKTCYLVIDRSAELVAKPLKAFSELGQIPPDEFYEKTLPVFDNHRVASRFSARNQRVFKVPDSQLLHKTAPYLQAKGITRLLIDGQVYRF